MRRRALRTLLPACALALSLAAKHLVASLDKFKVPGAEKKDPLAFVDGVKADIVEKK